MQIGWLQIVVIGLVVLILFGKLPNIIQDVKSAYLELSKKNEEKNNCRDIRSKWGDLWDSLTAGTAKGFRN